MHQITFQQAIQATEGGKRHLLIGNGFSIALFPKLFPYKSLLEQADFSNLQQARQAFDLLNTTDFETVIAALRQAATLLPLYSPDPNTCLLMHQHAEALKELLVQVIAGQHPERPADISETQYAACRSFLAYFVGENRIRKESGKKKDFRGNIYTLNYDLLLYWTLLHDDLIKWDSENPLNSTFIEGEELKHDDGFRSPDGNPDANYVAWDAEGASDGQNIHYLHGALHLFDNGPELEKKCWERSGGIPLIEQIRSALNEGKFPLFVSEGNSDGKLTRIRHSGYLQRSLKSFAKICQTPASSLFIYGHSLHENDGHVLKYIGKGRFQKLCISLYGDPGEAYNRKILANAQQLAAVRDEEYPLEIYCFDATQARVWG